MNKDHKEIEAASFKTEVGGKRPILRHNFSRQTNNWDPNGGRVNPLIESHYAKREERRCTERQGDGGACNISYLRKTPPRRLAFKHSGGDSRLCTSATVTLYLLVLLSNDNRPGTEQNTSEGCAFPVSIAFSLLSDGFMSATRMRSGDYAFHRLGINYTAGRVDEKVLIYRAR